MRTRVTVECRLEFGLEEQVAGLPPRDRRLLRGQRHQRVAVGPEPAVLPQRDHLAGDPIGEAECLQQPHDLVVDVDRPRQPVDLVVALEYGDLVTGAPEQRRERLADGAVPHDRDVDLGLHDALACLRLRLRGPSVASRGRHRRPRPPPAGGADNRPPRARALRHRGQGRAGIAARVASPRLRPGRPPARLLADLLDGA